MSRRDWRLFVEDMREAIDKINLYLDAMSFEQFASDSRTVDAVVRNLEVIGEAARCIPDAIKVQRSEIDWAAINGLRNRIVHEYFGLSLSILWAIAQNDLPKLASQLSDWQLSVAEPPED